MIKITKEKEVNKDLLESALTIVIDDDIIKPEIITSEERVVGHHSDYPEVEYYYRDKWFRMTLLPEFFLDSTIAIATGIIRFQASKYFRENAGEK
jgi:hypothetical protein